METGTQGDLQEEEKSPSPPPPPPAPVDPEVKKGLDKMDTDMG